MTIRWKLNLAVVVQIAVFLATAAFAMHAVTENADQAQSYSRMRELAQLTSDIRTDIYMYLMSPDGILPSPETPEEEGWPRDATAQIATQVRLATDEQERMLWENVQRAVTTLDAYDPIVHDEVTRDQAVWLAEWNLRALRSNYDRSEHEVVAAIALTSLVAQEAIWLACVLTVMLFLVYLILIRDWLIKPIDILKRSADTIGEGALEHRVPLQGHDELAQLARRIDAMAMHLTRHQSALLEARELSAIGELCANVAHGLRNPLAAMRASAQLARKRAGETARTGTLLDDLISQVDRMNERITRLFEFSRPTELRRSLVSFQEVTEAARAEVAALLKDRGITLTITDETAGFLWPVDREQIADALSELISNAAHHSGANDEIVVRVRRVMAVDGVGRCLEIQVVDHGAGMQAATAEKAFTLFFTSRQNGTGMGLAMVRRIVERHDGEVKLASQPGEGTTVTICIPEPMTPSEESAVASGL